MKFIDILKKIFMPKPKFVECYMCKGTGKIFKQLMCPNCLGSGKEVIK